MLAMMDMLGKYPYEILIIPKLSLVLLFTLTSADDELGKWIINNFLYP